MASGKRFAHLASQGDSLAIGGAGSWAELYAVSVNTGAASAVVNVYAANPSVAGSRIAKINASNTTLPAFVDFDGGQCRDGLFIGLDGGNADVTITYK